MTIASAVVMSLAVPPNRQMSMDVVDVYFTTTPSEPSVVLCTISPGVTSPKTSVATVRVHLPPTDALVADAATLIWLSAVGSVVMVKYDGMSMAVVSLS